ncbi:MAG: Asp-tRNA(Asn)/Glu-tRNA(Gln) amidotransferase subunit GatC [bacterium]
MNIKETVNKTAQLSRLQFEGKDLDKFENKFESILEFISIIDELDLENVSPVLQIVQYENEFRKDIHSKVLDINEALINAPSKDQSFIKVPKVINRND